MKYVYNDMFRASARKRAAGRNLQDRYRKHEPMAIVKSNTKSSRLKKSKGGCGGIHKSRDKRDVRAQSIKGHCRGQQRRGLECAAGRSPGGRFLVSKRKEPLKSRRSKDDRSHCRCLENSLPCLRQKEHHKHRDS